MSEVLLFLTGAALMVVVFSTVTSLIQLIAPDEMRGRVMSIYMVAFRGRHAARQPGERLSRDLARRADGHRHQRRPARRRRGVFLLVHSHGIREAKAIRNCLIPVSRAYRAADRQPPAVCEDGDAVLTRVELDPGQPIEVEHERPVNPHELRRIE